MTVQQKLYEAFLARPVGRLSSEVMLGQLRYLLELSWPLRVAADLLLLSDDEARIALGQLPSLDLPYDPNDGLKLVALARP